MNRRTHWAIAESIVAPLSVYGILAMVGTAPVWALLASAAVSVVLVAVRYVRTRRVNALGVIVAAEFLLSILIATVTGDARLMLAKPAVTSVISATAFGATLYVSRPLLAYIHRDFSTDPEAFDSRWDGDADFRTLHRRLTLLWIGGLLASAALVVTTAYLAPFTAAVILTQIVPVPLYLALIGWTQRRFHRRAPELHATPTG